MWIPRVRLGRRSRVAGADRPGHAADGQVVSAPLTIDEAQHAPALFPELKRLVDAARRARRTKDGEEVDFLLVGADRALALDAKLAVQGVRPARVPPGLARVFPALDRMVLVTIGGERRWLSRDCEQVPVAALHDLLVETFGA